MWRTHAPGQNRTAGAGQSPSDDVRLSMRFRVPYVGTRAVARRNGSCGFLARVRLSPAVPRGASGFKNPASEDRNGHDVSDGVFSDRSGACRSITGYRRPTWQRYEKRARSLCARHRETLQTRVRCQCLGYGCNFEMPTKKQRENQHPMSGCTPGPWAIAGEPAVLSTCGKWRALP